MSDRRFDLLCEGFCACVVAIVWPAMLGAMAAAVLLGV